MIRFETWMNLTEYDVWLNSLVRRSISKIIQKSGTLLAYDDSASHCKALAQIYEYPICGILSLCYKSASTPKSRFFTPVVYSGCEVRSNSLNVERNTPDAHFGHFTSSIMKTPTQKKNHPSNFIFLYFVLTASLIKAPLPLYRQFYSIDSILIVQIVLFCTVSKRFI